MALYFNSKLQGEGKPLPGLVVSHRIFPLTAVGWSQNKVTVVAEDGAKLATIASTTAPTVIRWNPAQKVLVVGWRDGSMTLWTEEGQSTLEAPAHEGLSVLNIEWTHLGTAFLSSAKSGAVVLWQLEGSKANQLGAVKADFLVETMTNLSFPSARAESSEKRAEDDDTTFVVGGQLNQLFLLDENQSQLSPFITLDGDVNTVAALWEKSRRTLLVLASNNILYSYHVDFDSKVTLQFKRKISSGPGTDLNMLRMIELAPGLVALSSGESEIRILNIELDVMYSVPFPSDPTRPRAKITTICSLPNKHLLAAGVKEGRMALWCYCGPQQSTEPDDWQQLTCVEMEGVPVDVATFTAVGTIAAIQGEFAVVMQKADRKRKWSGTASAVQVSPDTVVVETAAGVQAVVKGRSNVKDLDLSYPQLALWNGRQVDIYSISESTSVLQESFDQVSPVIGLHPDGMIVARGDGLLALNYQKHPLASINFASASEGTPILMDIMGPHLAVVTSLNIMKIMAIKSRELTPVGPNRPLKSVLGEGRTPIAIRINSSGKKVAFMTKQNNSARIDTLIWVYDVETDKIANLDFAELGQIPETLYWNTTGGNVNSNDNQMEPLLLCCETKPAGGKAAAAVDESVASAQDAEHLHTNHIWTLFATPTSVVPHHSFQLKREEVCLLGCSVPNLLLCMMKGVTGAPAEHRLEIRRLRDFEGMAAENDPKLRDALMQFSYHATVGNMDEAYRAVKGVKDPLVWANMARLCIATKRLDVAEVCLANMGDGLAARTLREAKGEPQVEARLGTLALALGLSEDAERLFRQCKRYDLLTELYVAAGRWDEAERHAEAYDRIRIQPVKFRRGEHLERSGQIEAALRFYQAANCFAAEAPRLMFQLQRIEELRQMVTQSNDKELLSWWAQYLESVGDVNGALTMYKQNKDIFNWVRLLVAANKVDDAVDVLSTPEGKKNPGAAYFIARFYQQSDPQRAVNFFDQAKAYRHAIRLAKENELFNEIVSLSLKCDDKAVALDSAIYFDSRAQYDKAVQLYQKAGDTSKAIDVCIKGGLYDALHQISETLDSAADPETFISMAEHFINSGHFDKAAQMLVFAKAFNEALQLCMDKQVKLTDEMAEAMTLPKTESDEDEAYRISLLKKIAKVAKEQGSWHLACKKYTQAGERVKAMKMLLQSGDTEKVVFFANHSRNAEIYQLAGNYLQNQNWQNDANVYKQIVTFYTKAKAYEPLAGFYDAASQVQIDEFRDYDKALLTLKEAQAILDKSDVSMSKKQLMAERVAITETFVNARRMIKPGEPCPQMVSMCQELLAKSHRDHPMREIVESSIRVGDVYALLVEYYDKLGQVENAYGLIERMLNQEIELTYFLEGTLIDKIYAAMGKDPSKAKVSKPAASAPHRSHSDDEVDYVDEDVE